MVAVVLKYLAIAGWSACVGGLVWYCLAAARRITYVTLADGRQQERKIPFVFRLLLPFVPNLDGLVMRPGLEKKRNAAERKLVAAGFDGLLSGREFVALQFMMPLLGAVVCGLLLWGLSSMEASSAQAAGATAAQAEEAGLGEMAPMLLLGGVTLFYLFPLMWLKGALKARHKEILRALPFVLDLLTLSVESGLDFMSALQRNCERRKLDALNEELIRMIREIQVGTPRRTALKNLAARVDLSDLRSVTHALVQADELGVSIGAILRIQSDQMRQRRFERAEKLANEAPTKMLAPLMLCIFPATIIILMGPVLLRAMENMM